MNLNKKKIIVIGGAAAGPSAAAKAKRLNHNNEVILYEKGSYISVGTCEIPYVLSGLIEDYKKIVFYDPESFYSEKKVVVKTKHLISNINRAKKEISVIDENGKTFEDKYDKLILCTGSKNRVLPNFVNKTDNVFNVKTIDNLISIQDFVKRNNVKDTVIIGAGYIGLELIDFIKKINSNLVFIEKENLPLPSFEQDYQKLVLEELKKNNIEFIGGVEEIKPTIEKNKVTRININGDYVKTDMVLLVNGLVPNSGLATAANITTYSCGGIKVDSKLMTSDDNIFAAGDCAMVIDHLTNKQRWLPLATIAHNQGHVAGSNAAGINTLFEKVVRNICLKFLDSHLALVGLSSKECLANNIKYEEESIIGYSKIKIMPQNEKHTLKLLFEKNTKRILGANIFGSADIISKANLISFAIKNNITVEKLQKVDFCYTPTLSPFIDSLSLISKKINKGES